MNVSISEVTLPTLEGVMVCLARATRKARWVAVRPMSALT